MLMFECSFDYKRYILTILKKSGYNFSKSMLKSEKSNVYLWNSFAHLEQNNSKMTEVVNYKFDFRPKKYI